MTVKELLEKLPPDSKVLELNPEARYLIFVNPVDLSTGTILDVMNMLKSMGIVACLVMCTDPKNAVKVLELIRD